MRWRSALKTCGLTDHVIVGVGGIHESVHVINYLDAGVTVVQAAPVVFEDTLFGAKALGALSCCGTGEPTGPNELLQAVEENAMRAILQVGRERPEASMQRVQQFGMEINFKHERRLKKRYRRAWRQLRAPSVADITKELLGRLGPKR